MLQVVHACGGNVGNTSLVFPSLPLSICIKAHIRMCAIDDADIDMRGLATSQLHCINTHMSYNPCGRTTLPAPPTLALSFSNSAWQSMRQIPALGLHHMCLPLGGSVQTSRHGTAVHALAESSLMFL